MASCFSNLWEGVQIYWKENRLDGLERYGTVQSPLDFLLEHCCCKRFLEGNYIFRHQTLLRQGLAGISGHINDPHLWPQSVESQCQLGTGNLGHDDIG